MILGVIMKVEIKEERQNPFLKRSELKVDIDHSGESTPKKAELQQWIAKEKKKDVTSIEIVDIVSDTGKSVAKANVFLWDEKKVSDLSKEPAKEETPAEEKPQEKKEEIKDAKAENKVE